MGDFQHSLRAVTDHVDADLLPDGSDGQSCQVADSSGKTPDRINKYHYA